MQFEEFIVAQSKELDSQNISVNHPHIHNIKAIRGLLDRTFGEEARMITITNRFLMRIELFLESVWNVDVTDDLSVKNAKSCAQQLYSHFVYYHTDFLSELKKIYKPEERHELFKRFFWDLRMLESVKS